MKSEHMLMYALVFVLGFMVSRMMGGQLVEGNCLDQVPIPPGCIAARCTKWNEGSHCKNAVPTPEWCCEKYS